MATSDNRTTELREKLDDLIIELDRLDIALDSPASDMTLGEYEQEREKLLDGFIQAIAATLGSGTCEMETLERCDGGEPHYRCKACGHENNEDEPPKFCPECGRKVK